MVSPSNVPPQFSEFIAAAANDGSQALSTLEELADLVGAEQLFVHLFFWSLAKGTLGSTAENLGPVEIETAAYYLSPKFQIRNATCLNPFYANKALTAVDMLRSARMRNLAYESLSAANPPNEWESIRELVRSESSMVRGSAYPEQTAIEINEIQGKFDSWFEKRVGINPTRSVSLVWNITQTIEGRINSLIPTLVAWGERLRSFWKKIRNNPRLQLTKEERALFDILPSGKAAAVFGCELELCRIGHRDLPVSIEDIKIEPPITHAEWKAFQTLIGCSATTRPNIDSPLYMSRRPLIVFSDGRVLLGDPSNALDQIWAAFDEAVRADQVFYDKSYQPTRAKWLEEKTASSISRVFPVNHIYRELSYPDPEKPPGSTAELDIAVYWDPFLVLIEAKASQFRFESQMGDIGRLRTDLKKNVEDAFNQARRAVKYLESQPISIFTEPRTGRILQIDRSRLQRIYLMTVSQHHLGSLATRLATLHSLNLFLERQYPWALSIGDLDVITQFCEGPDVFLHYAEKRLALQRENIKILGDEMEFFGAYLKSRLQLDEIVPASGSLPNNTPNFIWLSGFQESLDKALLYQSGHISTPSKVNLDIPQEIREILGELRVRQCDPEARWIAFTLLTLSNQALHAIAEMFREGRTTRPEPNMLRRVAHTLEDTVFVVVVSKDVSVQRLRSGTEQRVLIEKYRRRLPRGIGFGIHLQEESRPFHCAIWADFPWIYDQGWEDMLNVEPPPIPVPGTKMPGRNKPCFCGSSKKFKKCCEPKLARAKKNLPSS